MSVSSIVHGVVKSAKSNVPEILTGFGVAGVITTSYLAGKASYRASEIIHEEEEVSGTPDDQKERIKQRVKMTWKLYIPTGISGAFTIGCIIGAAKASGKRTAAAVTAYSITEKVFSEYREKVAEQIGKNKEEKIRDEIAADQVAKYPPVSREIIVTGGGDVLCCELYTHRYFKSDMETLRRAQNNINHLVMTELYVSLDEFYDELMLPHTSVSSELGWNFEQLMDLKFTTVLAENGEPCLAFTYNYVKPLRE